MAQQCERGLKDEGLSQQKRVVRVTCSGTIFTAEALRLAAARCLTFLCYLSAVVAAATAGLIVCRGCRSRRLHHVAEEQQQRC